MHLDSPASLSTLNITVQFGHKLSLVRNQAAGKVVLDAESEQEGDDPGGPGKPARVVGLQVGAQVGVTDNHDCHLNDLKDGPDNRPDDKERHEYVDIFGVLPVCTDEAHEGDDGDTEVDDSEDDEDCVVRS